MKSQAAGFWAFLHAIFEALREPKINRMLRLVIALLLLGTVFYHFVEGWKWIDSLYFCVITLATVGYGDLSPDRPITKLFTVFYLLIGIGTLLALVNAVAVRAMARSDAKNAMHRPHRIKPG